MKAELIGRTLDGRFQITGYLGGGNFGQVYRARQLAFGVPLRNVALKLFFKGRYDEAVREALREVAAVTALAEQCSHMEGSRYLIRVYDVCLVRDLDRPAVVMEIVDRGSLQRVIREEWPIPVARGLRLMQQICQGMAVLHSSDPPHVHRDLKTANVLITRGDEVRIADFGLSRVVEPLLKHSTAAGDYSCQPPEALLEGIYTPASDVWAMGMIFYEMFTRHNPFARLGGSFSAEELRWRHFEARKDLRFLPPPSERCPELRDHPGLEAVIMRCLAFDARDRYPGARELLEDLGRLALGRAPEALRGRVARPGSGDVLAEARYHVHAGRLERALELLEEARRLEPGDTEVCADLCGVYLALGRAREALDLALEGLRTERRRDLYLSAAKACQLLGNQAMARQFYREAERCGR